MSETPPVRANLTVVETNPHSDPRWREFLDAHPEASIYHHPEWLKALEEEYRQESAHLACEGSDGKFVAVLPLLYTRGLPFKVGGPLTRRRLASLPRTPIAGPLSLDPKATLALTLAAVSKVRKESGISLQIKTQGLELDGLCEGLVCSPWRFSYQLDLPASPDQLFRLMKASDRAKIKWTINKAARLGVHVRAATSEADLRGWYELYLDTMRRNVVPPRPYRFFAALWEGLREKGMMDLVIAEQQEAGRNRLLAGSVFLRFGRTTSYAFNGSRRAELALRPNDLIQWHAINAACSDGFASFDFGEVPEGNTDLAKFKSKWGSEPRRLYRYYYPGTVVSEGQNNGSDYTPSLASAMWRHLPLGTTAWLGDRLYRYL